MSEICEINSSILAVKDEDNEYDGIIVAETVVEREGETIYLTATYDGLGTISFGANDTSTFGYYARLYELSDEESDDLGFINQRDMEYFMDDDDELFESDFASFYINLAAMVKEKLLELNLADDDELVNFPE